MSSSTNDMVLAHLRKEKIKLWLPPYRNLPAGDANDEALYRLAGFVQQSMPASSNNSIQGVISTRNSNSGDGNVGDGSTSAAGSEHHQQEYPSVNEICTVLKELQSHAIQKLKEKNSINVKILASTKQHFAPLLSMQGEGDTTTTASATNALFPSSWGDKVTIVSTSQKQKNDKALHLHLANLSSNLTINQFSDDLCRVLDAKTVRVIWKGKNLACSRNKSGGGEVQDGTLKKIMLGSSSSDQKKKGELLCLVTGFGYVPAAHATSMAAASAASATVNSLESASTSENNSRSESDIIASIRQAAHTIQSSNSSQRFEVTDQSGNLVPMLQGDTVAFLTALGLHRIGRSKMEKRDAFTAMMSNSTTSATLNGGDEDTKRRDDIASALVFLLEADAENNSPALEGWQEKVDNYGLLQLDIAWCYLLLESLDGLTDAVRRLDIAERVLRKQVHSNFVTLAIAGAEMERPIPPLCAIFVRLFLLQGVANKMQNCNTTAAERLGWAQLLCNRLRSSAPPDSVEVLCNAYFVDPSTAIAALRRSNGDADAAGNFITSDRDEEQQAAKKRRRQYKIGKCANGTDYLNLDLVPTLSGLLGFDCTAATTFDGGSSEHGSFEDKQSTSTLIVVGLLRLSNNIIDEALELYNSIGADQVLERVAQLDEASGRKKKQSKPKKPAEHEVQDVDLAMLVSMGVDESRARNALKATGNVESALFWLSKEDDGAGAADDAKANEDAKPSDAVPLATNGDLESGDDSSSTHDHSGSDEGSDDTSVDDAFELLERELGNALGTDSKQLLEKEWLGVDMQDEWDMIQKYI